MKIRTRADALSAAREAEKARDGFLNKRRNALAAGLDRRASEAADDAAEYHRMARDFRALADSL